MTDDRINKTDSEPSLEDLVTKEINTHLSAVHEFMRSRTNIEAPVTFGEMRATPEIFDPKAVKETEDHLLNTSHEAKDIIYAALFTESGQFPTSEKEWQRTFQVLRNAVDAIQDKELGAIVHDTIYNLFLRDKDIHFSLIADDKFIEEVGQRLRGEIVPQIINIEFAPNGDIVGFNWKEVSQLHQEDLES